jgi:PAS domain S-box-containing protein
MFFTENIIDLSQKLDEFISSLDYNIEYNLYKNTNKYRIGISKKDKLNLELVDSMKKTLNYFNDNSYNKANYTTIDSKINRTKILKNGLTNAIKNNEFILYAQPIVNIKTKKIESLEILLRWNHSEFGIVSPNEFLEYAEITGIIYDIDLWVIENSFKLISEYKDILGNIKVHINLSSKSLENEKLILLFEKYNYKNLYGNITLEITEKSKSNIIMSSFKKIKDMGFSFAIDNFGTGYSSFERIEQIGIDCIKIDRSLIDNIVENPNDIVILKAILNMCKNLNIDIVAEGVEKIEQLEFLKTKNCNVIQGYIFSKPIEFIKLVKNINFLDNKINEITDELNNDKPFDSKFYNNGQVYIQESDSNLKLVNLNIQLALKLGYDFDEIYNAFMYEFIVEEERIYLQDSFKSLNHTGNIISIMITLYSKKGEKFNVLCATKLLENNNYRSFIEFSDEVYEDKRSIVGLSESYIESFSNSPVGMIILSDDFNVLNCNNKIKEIFKFKGQKLIGENIFKLLGTKKSIPAMMKMLNNAIDIKKVEEIIELENVLGNKIICQWNIQTIEDRKEHKNRFICTVQDITEKLKAEEEKVKIHNAIDQSKSAIVMIDLDGKFQYVNKAFSDLTLYNENELIGKHTSLLSSKEESEKFYNDLSKTIKHGEIWSGEFHEKRKDGSFFWSDNTIYPVKSNGKLEGYMCMEEDITAKKELLHSNADLKLRLIEQDKIASLGMLTSGIMHEINNPLGYIQSNLSFLTDLFKNDKLSDDDLIEIKDTISDLTIGVSQIVSITNSLKKYIFNRDTEETEIVNLIEEIKEILIITKSEYKYHANVELKYNSNEEFLINGYSPKIKQVFMNLIINAVYAIEEKHNKEVGIIRISLKNRKNKIFIKVADTGTGMSDEVKENIFKPLFTTKEKSAGSGIGLSISKQIIEEAHKGSLTVNSVLGEGTTFLIELEKYKKSIGEKYE